MWLVLIAIAWYASGLAGMAIAYEFDNRRAGYDITVGDLVDGCFWSIFGPIVLVASAVCALSWFRRSNKAKTVIIPARRAH